MVIIKRGEVFIFKAASEDLDGNSEDQYSRKLRELGLTVHSVPVLDFEYYNLELLQEQLNLPHHYSGVIFTSPRSVKAVSLCLGSKELPMKWQEYPSFVVGEGTKDILARELGLKGQGSDTGSAVSLAEFIIQREYKQPLLFPCGNLKRDVFSCMLAERGIQVNALTVYQTKPHPNLEKNLVDITFNSTWVAEFLVYFSPSGVKSSVPILRKLQLPLEQLKIVAIGPTTEKAVRELHLPLWSTASKPTPEHLVDAMFSNTEMF